jgi:hypothetical protein
MKAKYYVEGSNNEWIFIVDDFDENCPSMTVTNDAESVVGDLHEKGLLFAKMAPSKRIFYLDTEGNIDELIHDGGRFIRFRSGVQSPDILEQIRRTCKLQATWVRK